MANIIPDRYNEIWPSCAYLGDEAVLIQAWKKSHEYIRRQNWYADCLELDVTAATLLPFLGTLRDRLSLGTLATYRPAPMRMVPAPKSHQWLLNNDGWTPRSDDDKPFKLRPLAHLSIMDQTVATTTLICLANAVETAQGESSISEEDKAAGCYKTASYGNRLVCSWNNGRASFRWGNSQLYRKYYIDYQTYLYRGTSKAERLATEDGSTLIIRTDLSQCYDRVDRQVLVRKLKQLWFEYRQDDCNDDAFYEFLQGAFQWRWHDSDTLLVNEYLPCEASDPMRFGLPQGLAASGFFCNAYLVHFDRAIGHEIDHPDPNTRWHIRDYCRYVDDMTFVVQHESDVPEQQVVEEFVEHLNTLAAEHAPGQTIHKGKTSVTSLERLERAVPLAATMAAIQREVSGPMDVTTAEQVLGMLDGLFQKSAVIDAESLQVDDGSPLSVLFATEPDVRATTVDRFGANRWKSVFRTLRLMTGGEIRPGSTLDSDDSDIRLLDQRAVEKSRQLVHRWLEDPSNVMLLRIAFDLFPSPTYLEAVLSLLRRYLFEEAEVGPKVRLTCLYVASELFRAAAVETGLAGDDDLYPAYSDADKYRDTLRRFADECIQHIGPESWYLYQQIVIFLATLGESPDHHHLGRSAGLRYEAFVSLLQARWPETEYPVSEVVPLILLLEKVLGNTDHVAGLLVRGCNRLGSDDFLTSFRLVLTENEGLAKAFVRKLSQEQQAYWEPVLNAYGIPSDRPSQPLANDRWYNLATVIHQEENPFCQEIAAVRLMLTLANSWPLRQQEYGDGTLSPSRIEVRCCDWKRILNPDTFHDQEFLQVHILTAATVADERFAVPSWCPKEDCWKVEIAQVVRASIIGNCDYSSMLRIGTRQNLRQKYRGLRTSWIKRKHGLYNERSVLGGWDVPVSPWLSEVLTVLLSWPGMVFTPEFAQVSGEMSPGDLATALNDRLKILGEDYGTAIQAPIYVCPIRAFRPAIDAGKLTIGIVQTALPRDDDFEKIGLQLDEQAYRRRHRRLLTAVLKLLQKTIEVRSRTDERRMTLDLVVLPELAVHVEDLGIIKQFVNKVPCMVFCGLVFHDHPFKAGHLVNSGAWIIPQTGENGREFLCIEQGKAFLTDQEQGWGIASYRPCQWVIQDTTVEKGWRLSAAICKDMTAAELHSDMKNHTDGFVVSALNRDVHTFDDIVTACRFTMFQHIILVNSGQYGGSTVQAPYKEEHRRILVQHHGMDQTIISICEANLFSCREGKEVKTRPAGVARRGGT